MPDVYISRSGMMEKQVEEKFTKTELSDLKSQLEKQEQKSKILSEKAEMNEKTNLQIAERLNKLLAIFRSNPTEMLKIVKGNKQKIQEIFGS